jgi:regulator of replication initiation timing
MEDKEEMSHESELRLENEGLKERVAQITRQMDYYREWATGHKDERHSKSAEWKDSQELIEENEQLNQELKNERHRAKHLTVERKEEQDLKRNMQGVTTCNRIDASIQVEMPVWDLNLEQPMKKSHKMIREYRVKRVCKSMNIKIFMLFMSI